MAGTGTGTGTGKELRALSDAALDGQAEEGRIPFRVRIGITGHRKLGNEAVVEAMLVSQFQRIRELYPETDVTPVAFTVLTALAEGADRLAPRVAAGALRGADVDFVAVLPLTPGDYLTDFENERSRQEFERLLEEATWEVDLAPATKVRGDQRKRAYERAGQYIVDRSDIVIALWDEGPPRGRGGTATIVQYARDREVPLLIVPVAGDHRESAAVTRAVANGAAGESMRKAPTGVEPQPLDDSPRWRATSEEFRRIDEYNKGSLMTDRLAGELAEVMNRERRLSQPSIRHELESVCNWVLPHYVRADVLALRYQSRYTHLSRAIHFLAAFAVGAVAVEVAFVPDNTAWLGWEIFFLLLLIISVRLGRRGRFRERWIANRSLAEALRSAQFIAMTGARDRDTTDRGTPSEPDDQWFQRAFSEAWKMRPRITLHEAQAPDLRTFVVEGWIADQIKFHEQKAERHLARRNLYTRIVYVLAAVTIVVAALHIAELPSGHGWSKAFTFIAITLPGFGAAVTGMREGGQHRLHEERSRKTAKRLEQLTEAPDLRGDLASVRALVVDTHRVIVEEALGWSSVLEFQDLEMLI